VGAPYRLRGIIRLKAQQRRKQKQDQVGPAPAGQEKEEYEILLPGYARGRKPTIDRDKSRSFLLPCARSVMSTCTDWSGVVRLTSFCSQLTRGVRCSGTL